MDASSATSPQSHSPEESRPPRFTGRVVAGLTVIVVGVLFLLDALDVPGIGDVWHVVSRVWPAVFVAIGLAKLAEARSGAERTGGLIWVLLGGVWLANNYDLVSFNIWRAFWPALLIIFGISILTRATTGRFIYRVRRRPGDPSAPTDAGSRTSALAFMSGATRRVSSPDFQGGEDNRKETAGNPAKVLIIRGAALMGGVEIKN